MNKKLISKCKICGKSLEEHRYKLPENTTHRFEPLPQPIQKEEEHYSDKEFEKFRKNNITPTPSDTFIEGIKDEVIKVLEEQQYLKNEDIGRIRTILDTLEKEILKSSLQEQREDIEKEWKEKIANKIISIITDSDYFPGKISILQDIKQLLK